MATWSQVSKAPVTLKAGDLITHLLCSWTYTFFTKFPSKYCMHDHQEIADPSTLLFILLHEWLLFRLQTMYTLVSCDFFNTTDLELIFLKQNRMHENSSKNIQQIKFLLTPLLYQNCARTALILYTFYFGPILTPSMATTLPSVWVGVFCCCNPITRISINPWKSPAGNT